MSGNNQALLAENTDGTPFYNSTSRPSPGTQPTPQARNRRRARTASARVRVTPTSVFAFIVFMIGVLLAGGHAWAGSWSFLSWWDALSSWWQSAASNVGNLISPNDIAMARTCPPPGCFTLEGNYQVFTRVQSHRYGVDHGNCSIRKETSANFDFSNCRIARALLYWSASGTPPSVPTILLSEAATPKSELHTISASKWYSHTDGVYESYSAEADVTDIFQKAGDAPSFTFSDIYYGSLDLCNLNATYAGWGVVIILEYPDPEEYEGDVVDFGDGQFPYCSYFECWPKSQVTVCSENLQGINWTDWYEYTIDCLQENPEYAETRIIGLNVDDMKQDVSRTVRHFHKDNNRLKSFIRKSHQVEGVEAIYFPTVVLQTSENKIERVLPGQ